MSLSRGAAQDVAREIGQDVAQDVGQDVAQDVAQDVGQDVPQDVGQDVAQDVGQDVPQDVGQDAVRDLPQGPSRDAVRDLGLARLSLNQATTQRWSVPELIEGCMRAGVPSVGLWRDKVAEAGLERSARLLREAGLRVSSLCRGGFFPAATRAERDARIEDNRAALDEAAALGTDLLVLVCGGLPEGSKDLAGARAMVEDGVAALLPHAADVGVRLGIEPLHPMYCPDRSVIASLAEANDIVERLTSTWLGVVVDVFHVWWDPAVHAEIARAGRSILGFHVDDWLVPLPDVLLGRGLMGDGVIDQRALRRAVDAAGYHGPIEVEIFNQALWDSDHDTLVQRVVQRFVSEVLEPLG